MCWSIPGKITGIKDNIATVDISGVRKDVALDLIDGPRVGEYVLVHAGYAIQKVSEDKARFTIDFFKGGQEQ
ncbi:MAG: HypC/HybG/HupF family hydrogenase formation chaperone [Candidatus Omnitrophota bacterium]|nr:HypC/HybG/HupF family hydrogenase formation chaperone [Candidatus Omnitrophota bacterium]